MGNKNIRDYERKVTEKKGWTDAFASAIKDMVAEGGGVLSVPAGVYKTCSIKLESYITLNLEQGARLEFIDDENLYEVIETEFEGIKGTMYMPCIYAKDAEHVALSGDGIMDGNGQHWWDVRQELPHNRPYFVCFESCTNVKIEYVTLINSPCWTIHPLYCDNVRIHAVTIKNPAFSPNTDGIDPDCSSNIRISDCMIDVGDDCIAIKAGTEDTKNPRACENITITNCNMIHGHGGVVIGSEMSGSVRNVTVSNCVFQDTDRGIRLKTRRKRGGAMERLLFQNIVMDRVMCPFVFNMYYHCGARGKEQYVWDKAPYPVDDTTPVIRDVSINNVLVNDAQAAAGFFYGLSEQPVENVTMSDCMIRMNPNAVEGHPAMMDQMPSMKAAGFYMRNVKGVILERVKISGHITQDIDADDTAHYTWK